MAQGKGLSVQAVQSTEESKPTPSKPVILPSPIISTLRPSHSAGNISINHSGSPNSLAGISQAIRAQTQQSPIVNSGLSVKTKISRLPLPPTLVSPGTVKVAVPQIQQQQLQPQHQPVVTAHPNSFRLAPNIPNITDMVSIL